MGFIGGWFNQGTGGLSGLNVFSGSLKAFSRSIRKLSCRRLRMVMKLLQGRIKTLRSGWLGAVRNAGKIKALRRRYIIVKRVYRAKCINTPTPTSTSSSSWWKSFLVPGLSRGMRRKLMKCVAQATQKYPMPSSSGWAAIWARTQVIAKRRAFVKKCMNPGGSGGFLGGVFGGFDGNYSNQSGCNEQCQRTQFSSMTGAEAQALKNKYSREELNSLSAAPWGSHPGWGSAGGVRVGATASGGRYRNQSGCNEQCQRTQFSNQSGCNEQCQRTQFSNIAGPGNAVATQVPPAISTIPGQPFTSIPRPSRPNKPTVIPGPFIGGWPYQPQRQVPYHRHSIFDFEIKTGGPTRQKYPTPYPMPVMPPITPRPDKPIPAVPTNVPTNALPGRPALLPSVPNTRNFGGDTTSWQNDINS